MEFTQEIKDKWLNALKSGEYEQFNGRLRNRDNHKQMCCIGVLCNVIEEPITESGTNSVDGDFYVQLGEVITREKVHDLWTTNDNSYDTGIRDYSAVIPIIEQLSVRN